MNALLYIHNTMVFGRGGWFFFIEIWMYVVRLSRPLTYYLTYLLREKRKEKKDKYKQVLGRKNKRGHPLSRCQSS